MTGHVFISFDRAESVAYADGLARYLTDAGVPVWYDREAGGDQRWAQVVAQIQACTAFIVVMTPGVERSDWVRGEIDYARQLGKPILPLLLHGAPLASLSHLPAESLVAGAMPSADWIDRVRALAPYQPGYSQPAPTEKRRTGLIVALVAAGLAVVLCVAGAVVVGVSQLSEPDPPGTWQEAADRIDGIQNYLVSHPDWYVMPPEGNHEAGRLTYPVDPPAGGTHNSRWQNCMGDVYPEEVPKEHVMHSLEHGAVWVTYRPGLPKDQVDQLAARVRNVPFLLMSPYPGLDKPISLQAWGYQLKVDDADDDRVDEFISALRGNATQEPQASCSGGVTDTGSEPVVLPGD